MSERAVVPTLLDAVETSELKDLLTAPIAVRGPRTRIEGVIVGRLVAFRDDGTVPLVTYEGQPTSAALPAQATLDLHSSHIDRDVVLMFEDADPSRPIILGCLQRHEVGLPRVAQQIELEADGERLVISASNQVVLRCGKASLTLTRDGKILLDGTYVSNRSSGLVRIKGGGVHIN